MDLSGTSASQASNSDSQPAGSRVTPQLVKEVADIIYAMLLHDLKIEEERLGFSQPQFHSKHGGQS